MSREAFEAAMPFVLRWEGGFVDHPADPGGATNKGVIQSVYDDWRSSQGLPRRSVRQLEEAEMLAIYENRYWLPARSSELPEPIDLVQFDTAVNMGVTRAVQFLQRSVGAAVDGVYGPGTAQCVAECDPDAALAAYCDTREAFYRRIVERKPSQAVFLKGWMNRLNALRRQVGLAVAGSSGPGLEALGEPDFGDASFIARVPDLGVDPEID